LTAAFAVGVLTTATPASAHCDTTRGPVVTAATAALEAGDPALVLHWVSTKDEAAVRAAFAHTLQVRALGPEAKALADRYFFETLVRIHRAGEGAPYTGLNDGDPEPIIAATDAALARGSAAELEAELVAAVRTGLAERFAAARAAADYKPGDVAGGRAFVAAYVPLTHWVEGLHTAALGGGEHHAAAAPAHQPKEHHDAAGATGSHGSHGGGGHLGHLPWVLIGLLGLAVIIESGLLVRRRHAAQ
jgi:hypothetical protein